jgi:hypothetical protein
MAARRQARSDPGPDGLGAASFEARDLGSREPGVRSGLALGERRAKLLRYFGADELLQSAGDVGNVGHGGSLTRGKRVSVSVSLSAAYGAAPPRGRGAVYSGAAWLGGKEKDRVDSTGPEGP